MPRTITYPISNIIFLLAVKSNQRWRCLAAPLGSTNPALRFLPLSVFSLSLLLFVVPFCFSPGSTHQFQEYANGEQRGNEQRTGQRWNERIENWPRWNERIENWPRWNRRIENEREHRTSPRWNRGKLEGKNQVTPNPLCYFSLISWAAANAILLTVSNVVP